MGGGKVAPESSGASQDWSFPLMNSHKDIIQTLIACCVPCVQHGQICEKEGWGSCIMGALVYTGCYCCGCAQLHKAERREGEEIRGSPHANQPLLYLPNSLNLWRRENLRRSHNIKGNIADDILASGMCATCAIVQEYHQVMDGQAQ
ncbi:hypothetical protein HDU67_004820, partial [Dinochytrium kinnereticum]